MTSVHINAIGTAVPPTEAHARFRVWAEQQVEDPRAAKLFRRMAERSGIARRWSVLLPAPGSDSAVESGGFYGDDWPSTAARMTAYAEAAPALALEAIAQLGPLPAITHLVVASCTGFIAPGVDQLIAARLGLSPAIERTLIGFMGCYAAISALRTAFHIVRSQPVARVLVVNVELCTLHLQRTGNMESLLGQLQFGDGAAAALVSAEPTGFAFDRFFAATLPDAHDLIRWHVGDTGFAMHLSGEVPARIALALGGADLRAALLGDDEPHMIDGWAVHPGGRSILDAVVSALGLPHDAVDVSREVLHDYGNMSSATLMFVLARMLAGGPRANGLALAFGPGVAAEGFRFRSA